MLFCYYLRLFQYCTGENVYPSLTESEMCVCVCVRMRRSLKCLNMDSFPPQRCKDVAFGTFLAGENRAFGFIRHWHGNEAILIEIVSLLFIFAGSQLILEPNFCVFFFFFSHQRKTGTASKIKKISLASEANDKYRPILPREPFCRCLPLWWLSQWHALAVWRAGPSSSIPSLKHMPFYSEGGLAGVMPISSPFLTWCNQEPSRTGLKRCGFGLVWPWAYHHSTLVPLLFPFFQFGNTLFILEEL